MAYEQDYRSDPLTGPSAGGATGARGADTSSTYRGAEFATERDDAEAAAIERDIDRTRSRMDRTVDTLAERLRPSSIFGDVLDYFASDDGVRTESSQGRKMKRVAKRAGEGLWETVKANPMPSALIAGGVAWLMLKGNDDEQEAGRHEPGMYGGSYVDARTGKPYDMRTYGREYRGSQPMYGGYREESGPGMGERMKHYASEAVEGAKRAAGWVAEKAGDAAGSVSRATGDMAHRAGDAASGAAERTGGMASSVQHRLGDAASRGWEAARHGAGRVGERTRRWSEQASRSTMRRGQAGYAYSRERFESGLSDHPLSMGIAALAAGVLAGLAVPRTRREDELFGDYSHELKRRTGDIAHEAMHRGRASAEREGLTPDTIAGQAKDLLGRASESAGRVMEAAVSSAKEVGRNVAEAAKAEAGEMRHEAEDRGLTPKSVAEKAKHVAKEAAEGVREEGSRTVEDAKQTASSTSTSSRSGGISGKTNGGAGKSGV